MRGVLILGDLSRYFGCGATIRVSSVRVGNYSLPTNFADFDCFRVKPAALDVLSICADSKSKSAVKYLILCSEGFWGLMLLI